MERPDATAPPGAGGSPTAAVAEPDRRLAARRRAFDRLSAEIRRCTRCSLSLGRTRAVVYRGSIVPRVVFVGEAPGAEEDRLGVPFVGRSGQLLDRAIEGLGPPLGEFGVLNLLKCRPPENRFDPAAARTCRPYLDRQLALLEPRALVSLGARALLALDPAAPPVLRSAGTPRPLEGRWLFPLVHPAAALRSTALRRRWEQDVDRLGAWLASSAFETL